MIFNVSEIDKDESGIYIIRSSESDRVYIGSSKNMRCRYNNHASSLRRNKHSCRLLQAHYNEHGPNVMTFEIFKRCGISELEKEENSAIYSYDRLFNSAMWSARHREKDVIFSSETTITQHIITKWIINGYPDYGVSADGVVVNKKRGTILKRTVVGTTVGYCISGKFKSLARVREMLEVEPNYNVPF